MHSASTRMYMKCTHMPLASYKNIVYFFVTHPTCWFGWQTSSIDSSTIREMCGWTGGGNSTYWHLCRTYLQPVTEKWFPIFPSLSVSSLVQDVVICLNSLYIYKHILDLKGDLKRFQISPFLTFISCGLCCVCFGFFKEIRHRTYNVLWKKVMKHPLFAQRCSLASLSFNGYPGPILCILWGPEGSRQLSLARCKQPWFEIRIWFKSVMLHWRNLRMIHHLSAWTGPLNQHFLFQRISVLTDRTRNGSNQCANGDA
jgi:hypothetical protein